MFYKDKIEMLERKVGYLEEDRERLKRDLQSRRILDRYREHPNDTSCNSISLEELEETQQRILDYLDVVLRITTSKTELVKKSK